MDLMSRELEVRDFFGKIFMRKIKSDENSEWSSDLDAIFCKENMRVRPQQRHNGPHTCGFEDTSGHKRPQTWAFHATGHNRPRTCDGFRTECWRSIPFEALSEGH